MSLSSTSLLSAAQDNFGPGHISSKEVLHGPAQSQSTHGGELSGARSSTFFSSVSALPSLPAPKSIAALNF